MTANALGRNETSSRARDQYARDDLALSFIGTYVRASHCAKSTVDAPLRDDYGSLDDLPKEPTSLASYGIGTVIRIFGSRESPRCTIDQFGGPAVRRYECIARLELRDGRPRRRADLILDSVDGATPPNLQKGDRLATIFETIPDITVQWEGAERPCEEGRATFRNIVFDRELNENGGLAGEWSQPPDEKLLQRPDGFVFDDAARCFRSDLKPGECTYEQVSERIDLLRESPKWNSPSYILEMREIRDRRRRGLRPY